MIPDPRLLGNVLLLTLLCWTALYAEPAPPGAVQMHTPPAGALLPGGPHGTLTPAPPSHPGQFMMPKMSIKSLGSFTARGDGMVTVSMLKGSVTIAGQGDFRVSNDVHVTFTGNPGNKLDPPSRMPPGKFSNVARVMPFVAYQGFHGEAKVTADHAYNVALHGTGIVVNAHGAGNVFIGGSGCFTSTKNGTAGSLSGKWAKMPPPGARPAAAAFGEGNAAKSCDACGTGNVNVQMQRGIVRIAGQGELMVNSNVHVSFTGTPGKKSAPHGGGVGMQFVTYQGFHGVVKLNSEQKYFILFRGSNIVLHAEGVGHAFFTGNGTYTNSGGGHHETGKWGAMPTAPVGLKPGTPAAGTSHVQFGDFTFQRPRIFSTRDGKGTK